MMRFVTEENKIKIDKFELLFNDTAAVFRPIQQVDEGRMGWLTTKNYYYQSLQENTQFIILGLFGQNVYLKDSLPQRKWKITNSTRNISGYKCRKALYEKKMTPPESMPGTPQSSQPLLAQKATVVFQG